MKKTVVMDFDGVIHSYTSGWQGATVIPDPPIEGIREAIHKIRESGYIVVIVSSRCYQPGGISAIGGWLIANQIYVDRVTGEKPPAIVYIDDRGLTFDGHPETLLQRIQSFRTWQGR